MSDMESRAAVALYGTPEQKAAAETERQADVARKAEEERAAAEKEAPAEHPGTEADQRMAAALYPPKPPHAMTLRDLSGRIVEEPLEGSRPTVGDLVARNAYRLERADLREKDLTKADLDGCNAAGASFYNARLGSARFGNFQNAQLEGTVFTGSLCGTDFRGAVVDERTDFSGVDITGAQFDEGALEKTKGGGKRAIGRPRVK